MSLANSLLSSREGRSGGIAFILIRVTANVDFVWAPHVPRTSRRIRLHQSLDRATQMESFRVVHSVTRSTLAGRSHLWMIPNGGNLAIRVDGERFTV